MLYYAIINNQKIGPVEESRLPYYGITRDTLVWREGMAGWVPIGNLPELSYLFMQRPAGNGYSSSQPKPDTYLAFAVLVTVIGLIGILVALPFGIIALIYATSVEQAYNEGRYEEAQEKSQKAKNWSTWGIIAAAVAAALSILAVVLVTLLGVGIPLLGIPILGTLLSV